MARTYFENTKLPGLKEEYNEDIIAAKFKSRMEEIRQTMHDRNEEETEAAEDFEALKKSELENIRNGQQPSYDTDEIAAEGQKIKAEYDNQVYLDEVRELMKYQQWLKEYGPSFVQLYQIKEEHEKRGESEKITLTEIDLTENKDILTDTQYNKMNADPNSKLKELALQVDTGEEDFAVVFTEYHQPNSTPQFKAQLSFDDDTLSAMNAEKLKRIFEFCERYGLSTADMSVRYAYDGSIDVDEELRIRQERLEEMTTQARELMVQEAQTRDNAESKEVEERSAELQKEYDAVVAANGGIVPEGLSMDDVSPDLPITEDSELLTEEQNVLEQQGEDLQQVSENKIVLSQQQTAGTPTAAPTAAPTTAPVADNTLTQKKVEKTFDEWIGTSKGLNKHLGLSYFKRHTGFFGKGWAEYIVYPTEDKDNFKDDGRRDKDDKHAKWNYSFKLFVRVDENGKLNLSYRTPSSKRMDEDIIGGIVGQFKDLGYTHINFPRGIPDNEKGMWRKALAEKGIVPIGISLDRSKAEGMLKAAKDKLSLEAYNKYKYKLGLQMDKNNKSKGKVVDESEQAFIDGLINSHKYAAFTEGYTNAIKGEMKRILRAKDPMFGAVKKIAAYRTLSVLFEAYQHAVERGTSLTDYPKLSPNEKNLLANAGLNGIPQNLTPQQMTSAFLILYTKQTEEAKKDMYAQLIKEKNNRGVFAKRSPKIIINEIYKNARNQCEAINEELQVKGVDEIGLIKAFDVSMEYDDFLLNYYPEYERNHPQPQQQTQQTQQPTGRSAQRSENSAPTTPSAAAIIRSRGNGGNNI